MRGGVGNCRGKVERCKRGIEDIPICIIGMMS